VDVREQLKLFVGDYVREQYPGLWRALAPGRKGGAPADDRVTEALLAPVVEAVSDARDAVARPAHYVLWALTDFSAAAREAVSELSRSPRGHVRTWAVLCVGRGAPRPFQLEVLRRGLSDRCSLARRQAADRALSYRLRELLPELGAAVARERGAAVRRELDTCHRLLRDGYVLTPAGRGYVGLTVAFDGGGVGTRTVSRAELRERGAETLAAEYRASRGS
jgi:hypothetical protein